jgi:murein DD-endopeptidase MepM/ murein hydrolase activator NlpD
LFILALLLPAAAIPRPLSSVSWIPRKITAGSPCLFTVGVASSISALRGKWQGHDIVFSPSADRRFWYGLAGVDVETRPGTYKLELEATSSDGKFISEERNVLVRRARYKTETLHVPDRFVEPDAEALRHIEADKLAKQAAFSHQIPEPEWSGNFVPPIDSTVSEGFGTRRTFNGKLDSIHRGLDYRAKIGSPVVAANAGEVVLARELFYEGNCVIIDHGEQFLTLYMHLSQIEVAEGDKVQKDQEIGRSGETGRVTGPHLHIAVRWQGAYVDPAQLWALPLPKLQPVGQPQARGQ